ncbi:hypothetical protein [Veillonella sp. R32]|uniref:hypothetical protein n=1 Tax=Veillonella sp. R32 TaxID=2021312 RepID=UPI00138A6308|nr:hypothetical protein [Veillonella sp. R32]KAF1680731.1 hypothetical protein VER_08155 [Veillonella sp. R32]
MKHVLKTYIMAALIGSVALGANGLVQASDVEVVKVNAEPAAAVVNDNGDVVAVATPTEAHNNTTGIMTKRISQDISPATNKALWEESDELAREADLVQVPEANAYYQRLAVSVSPVAVTGDRLHITYPTVTSVSPVVTKEINDRITKYVQTLQKNLEKANLKADMKENLYITYDVEANDKGIFSVLIKSYTIGDQAANGLNTVKAFTFNSTSGKVLSLGDFGGVSKEVLNTAINEDEDLKAQFFPENLPVDKVPADFYATADHELYLIFQQGTVGPMSSGTIYVPVGKSKR